MKERPIRVSPRYFNAAGICEATDKDSWSPVNFPLEFGKWYDIPTKEHHNEYFKGGGELSDIVLIPRKNIQADLLYQGEIECIDAEDLTSIGEFPSYPIQNPLFHSENMEIVEPGHYRFTTKYMPTDISGIPKLQNVKVAGKRTKRTARTEDSSTTTKKNNLIQRLRGVFNLVTAAMNGKDRKYGFYDYDKLFSEYLISGKISGDCKAASTFTAGSLDDLGLRSRIIAGNIQYGRRVLREFMGKKIMVDSAGHIWAEVYIPVNEKEGYWAPIDSSLDNFLTFPRYPAYSLAQVKLPLFKDQSVEKTKLKLQYV